MRTVRFNEVPQVHHIIAWNFAYRKAREKYWEFFALDDFRFKRRIQHIAKILEKILDSKHREKIINNPIYHVS